MVVLMKAIKPARLKDKAMRLELLNAMRKAAKVVEKDFEETVKTWTTKPTFKTIISLKGGPTILTDTATDSERYGWINNGTGSRGGHSDYRIYAGIYTGKSKKKALAFPSAFGPKTKPGRLKAGPGHSGGNTIMRPYVTHKGIKPRKFDEMIQKRRKPWYKKQMQRAMRKVSRVSGHKL